MERVRKLPTRAPRGKATRKTLGYLKTSISLISPEIPME